MAMSGAAPVTPSWAVEVEGLSKAFCPLFMLKVTFTSTDAVLEVSELNVKLTVAVDTAPEMGEMNSRQTRAAVAMAIQTDLMVDCVNIRPIPYQAKACH
jgi:hypothetical protein